MIRWFAGHPVAANLLMVLIAALGLLAAPNLKRETFPRFTAAEVGIEVPWPGASAADVEDAVCGRLADALEDVVALYELRCEALENRASAVAEMREGGDFGRFLDEVRTEVAATDDLPDDAEEPVVRELHRTDFVAAVAVTGPMSLPHLKAYAEDLKDGLLRLPGVAAVEIQGFSDHQIRISVPETVRRRYGIGIGDIADAIARNSLDAPAGTIETREREILLRFEGERRTPRELEDLPVVARQGGAEVRLGDIATITDTFEDPEAKILFNGATAAVLEVHKALEADSLRVVDALEDFVAAEGARAPETVALTLTQDVSSIVRDRLTMLVENGVQGLALVFLAMALFFGFRFSFWVAAGLPVAFLGALFVMAAMGLSLNMVTMTALLMAIGLMMDDAIVIAENIAARLHRGDGALAAVVTGTRQVAPGVMSSFLTTACVFAPLAFLSGNIGTVLEVLPVVLLVTLAVSLVEAFLILPHHLKRPVARMQDRPAGAVRRRFETGFAWAREHVIGAAADAAVRGRYLFAGLMLFLALVTVGYLAGGNVKFQAFPDIDGDVVEARLLLPQGTPLARTEAVVAEMLDGLQAVNAELTPAQPGGRALVESVQVRFGANKDAKEAGPHLATVIVDLLNAEQRTTTLDAFYARWREAMGPVPGAIALTLQEPSIGPQGIAFEFRLQGRDLDALKSASLALQEHLRSFAGTRDVMDDLRPGKPERRIRLREGATALGLDAATVAAQLRAAFLGAEASEIRVGQESYEIEVRRADSDRASLDALHDFTLALPDGRQVPLSAVATIEPARGWARILQVDGRRTVTVTGDVDSRVGNAMDIIREIKAGFLPELRQRFPGVEVAILGQSQEAETTGGSVRVGFLYGLLGVFLILAFQFRSYVEPLVVMVAIPFALMGAVWGHAAMGVPLSMPSVVGAASLSGVVVNNAILLVHFVKMRAEEGRDATAAARQASRDRFRSILLTSLTTIVGLLPLLAETSLQAQVIKPLVISVVFGLLASAAMVLLAVPALYSILADLGLATARAPAPPTAAEPGRAG